MLAQTVPPQTINILASEVNAASQAVSPVHRLMTRLLSALEGPAGHTVGRLGDWRMGSHFQPIYSLSHMRVVGHEALLRARDAQGQPVPPPVVFNACGTHRDLVWCDDLSRIVHLANFTAQMPESQWLFLNVHPQVFQGLAVPLGETYLRTITDHFNITGEKLVIEVLESEVTDVGAFEAALALTRAHGCLIAIDDFGAGHSNFDRVWRLQPDIVKLDRSLIARAASDRRAQRVVSQMVSLLHECGTMVLMEGVETFEEALIAMESDADMVQGYFFGRPQPSPVPTHHMPQRLSDLYDGLESQRKRWRGDHRSRIAPFLNAIGNAGVLLSASRSMEEACSDFLELGGAELCYQLDADGYQVGRSIWHLDYAAAPKQAYEPLRDAHGACWSRRPYFRRAVESIGKPQVTRPYRTLHGNHTCITASYAFHHKASDGSTQLRVICGDITWHEDGTTLPSALR